MANPKYLHILEQGNPEHIHILVQGVAAWNAWQDQNTDITPDFYGADLRWVNLNGGNLRGAHLGFQALSGEDFR